MWDISLVNAAPCAAAEEEPRMLYRVDSRPTTQPAPKAAPKGVAEAVAEAAKRIATDDDLQLSKPKVTPDQVVQAFERLEKAEAKARNLSVGTLGSFPFYQKALEEVRAAKEEIAQLRKDAPELVEAVEKGRASKPGFFDAIGGFFKRFFQPIDLRWIEAKLTGKD